MTISCKLNKVIKEDSEKKKEGEDVKKIVCAILLMTFLLIGCEKGSETTETDEIKSPEMLNIQNENKSLHEQVTQLQAQLQGAEQKYKDLQKATESNLAAQQPLTARYPKLADFSSPQEFQKIEIIDAKGSKTITDPAILKSLSLLIVLKNEASLGSGPQPDIEPVQYILATVKGEIKVSVVQQGMVTFDELYPGQYFEVDNAVYQLGKAFMNPPLYIGQEPAAAKMVNSGLLKVEENDVFYVSLAGRIRSVAMAFINAEKRESTTPKDTSASILNLTFYLYGEGISLDLYKGKAKIKDVTGEKWFDLKEEDIEQIKAAISAS